MQKTTVDNNDFSKLSSHLEAFLAETKRVDHTSGILDSLFFKGLYDRHTSISSAHAKTYHWIFETYEGRTYEDVKYVDWLKAGSNTYWISGKPGSGKSTLMKLLSDDKRTCDALNVWAHGKLLIIAKHSFWSGGTEMQTSLLGLLQSLLYQVLGQCPDLIPYICSSRWQAEGYVHQPPWTANEISTAFEQLATQDYRSVKICLFIDGLDECHTEHRDLVDMITQLSRLLNMKICVSSRPWNVFENAFGDGNGQALILQKYTRRDIAQYIQDKIEEEKRFANLVKNNIGYKELTNEILDKAEGVFLWVFLVVRSLLRGLDDGNDFLTMQKRIHDFPSDLEEYFQHILDNLESFYHTESAHIFLLAVQADFPLNLSVYFFLEKTIHDPEHVLHEELDYTAYLQEEFSIKEFKKQLNARCKDLLEIKEAPKRRCYFTCVVEFPHRTIEEFIRTKRVCEWFKSKALPNFDPLAVLCRVLFALVRVFTWQICHTPANCSTDYAFSVWDMVDCCYAIEKRDGRSEITLLDELDRMLWAVGLVRNKFFSDGYNKSINGRQEDTFLIMALRCGLKIYVTHKLNKNPALVLGETHSQPLLDYLLPLEDKKITHQTGLRLELRFGGPLYDLDMISLLLRSKADPNQKLYDGSGRTVWSSFLSRCWWSLHTMKVLHRELIVTDWDQIAELMILHGADLDVKCKVRPPRQMEGEAGYEGVEILSVSEILK